MPCSFEQCDKNAVAKGLCSGHYNQQQRGRPLAPLRPHRAQRPQSLTLEEALAWYLPEPKRTERGCLVGWTGPISSGRPQISYKNESRMAAAWVCELAHGPPPGRGHEYEASHDCNNPQCLEAAHIVWKTRLENELDKVTIERAWHRLEDELGGGTAVLVAAIQRYGEAA